MATPAARAQSSAGRGTAPLPRGRGLRRGKLGQDCVALGARLARPAPGRARRTRGRSPFASASSARNAGTLSSYSPTATRLALLTPCALVPGEPAVERRRGSASPAFAALVGLAHLAAAARAFCAQLLGVARVARVDRGELRPRLADQPAELGAQAVAARLLARSALRAAACRLPRDPARHARLLDGRREALVELACRPSRRRPGARARGRRAARAPCPDSG